jgi:rhodanese-related sulfurtransferase
MQPHHNEAMKAYYARCDMAQIKGRLKGLLEEARKEITHISCEEVDSEEMVLIDVREPDEFASGTIPAKYAFTIPRGKLEFAVDDTLAALSDRRVVCYCLKGARGLLAALELKRLGFADVVNLEGGIEAWVRSGRPVRNYLGLFRLCE